VSSHKELKNHVRGKAADSGDERTSGGEMTMTVGELKVGSID
jgi:hypothetical protein